MRHRRVTPSCRYKRVSKAARAVRWHEDLYAYQDGLDGYFSPYSHQADNTGRRIQQRFRALRWILYSVTLALGISSAHVYQFERGHVVLVALAVVVIWFLSGYVTRSYESRLVEPHMQAGVCVPRYVEGCLTHGTVSAQSLFGLTGYAWALWESSMLRDTCRDQSPNYEAVQQRLCQIEESMCHSNSMETPLSAD